MNLENNILNERSQAQKVTYCMILFIWNVPIDKLHRESKSVVTLGEGDCEE